MFNCRSWLLKGKVRLLVVQTFTETMMEGEKTREGESKAEKQQTGYCGITETGQDSREKY